MTKVSASERIGLDTGETADWRSNAHMDMAMEMATVVTSIALQTAGEDTLESMERNKNGKRRRRNEVPGSGRAHGECKSCMDRAAQEQTRELAQLH
jgi:CelD/BcsL family acetyltransferase involved in cellulose biosynthesis